VKKFELQQHAKYVCPACGKVHMWVIEDCCKESIVRNMEMQRLQDYFRRWSLWVCH
jgi:hypothetical protein